MKTINWHSFTGRRSAAGFIPGGASVAAVSLVLAGSAWCADVTLNAGPGAGTGDAIDTSSFAAALNWSNGLAPAAGNAYLVPAGRSLRTPGTGTTDLVFGGDSLALTGNLVYKSITNVNTITINNLSLNGATVNNASNSSTPFILAGNAITILGTGASTLFSNNGTITVNAPIGGTTGSLTLSTNNTLGRQVILAGENTYKGNILVTGASGAVLASTGKLAFALGTSAYNSITGAVPFIFDGAFTINLSGASTVVGTSYLLVDTSTLVETFSSSFTVEGWTQAGKVWIEPGGHYEFDTTTGRLSRVALDSDLDGLADAWEVTHFGNIESWSGTDHADMDFCTNREEFLASTDPNNSGSFPDTEDGVGDGLPDGWEIFYFGNLAQLPGGDADLDFNTNAAEYAAASSPSDKFSYPDLDNGGVGDGMNDGWEMHYFTSLTAVDGDFYDDPDGDLFSNFLESQAYTDPWVQVSSPDTDFDNLPDGWEVKHFGKDSANLDTVILRQNDLGDPDVDGFSNLTEFKAGTDPDNVASIPSVLAYWRFEEKTTGTVGTAAAANGNQPSTVLDSSGLGNHLMTWASYTAPTYTTAVPFATVPLTSAANTASLAFTRTPANLFVTSNIYTTAGVGVNSHIFNAFTVEASFNTSVTNVWQVVVGKTGNPINGQAPFSLKIRASDNKLLAGIVDGAGTAKEAVSTRAITTGTWFSAVVTASATELKLWIKGAADANYVLEGTAAINGAFYTYPGNTAPWVIGLGKWNGVDADPFGGSIDEVRVSPKVLAPSEFLIPVVSNDGDLDQMDDTWEMTYFLSLGQTATGDFDKDGTDNLTEYRLGLVPNSGTSRFAATRSATGLMTWPSAVGLTFTVQRSTTLAAGSWTTVGTVPGTAGSASFTDPAPPVGTAFYKVLLQP